MDLYFLRNAKMAHSFYDDDDRPLSGKSERKMRRIAKGMNDAGFEFDAIMASPLIRSTQSAEIVADVYGMKRRLRYAAELAPRGNPAKLVDDLLRDYGSVKGLLLVGHEPYMSRLISVLLVGDDSLQLVFKRGGLCKLWADRLEYGRCASLCWLMAPSLLKRL